MDPSCHTPLAQALSIGVPMSILSASLLGSGHCAGMCGGLAAAMSPSRSSAALYHVGRLIGYAGIGFGAGWMGQTFVVGPTLWPCLTTLSAICLALTLILMGRSIWRGQAPHLPGAKSLSKIYLKATSRLPRGAHAAEWRHLAAGILTLFLPCGWLYGFVAGAAAMADPLSGALFMTVFWLGTLPALTAVSFGVRRGLLKRIGSPRIAGAIFILLGFFTLGVRLAHYVT